MIVFITFPLLLADKLVKELEYIIPCIYVGIRVTQT